MIKIMHCWVFNPIYFFIYLMHIQAKCEKKFDKLLYVTSKLVIYLQHNDPNLNIF